MTELRELLHDLADEPQRSVDPTALIAAGRRRRHRRRFASAFAATTVVVALGAGIFLVVPRSTRSSHIQSSAPASTTVQAAGLSLTLPPNWHQLAPLANSPQVLVVGTADLPSYLNGACTAHAPVGSAVFITITQLAPSAQPPIYGPTRTPIGPRPPVFSLDDPNAAGQNCPTTGLPALTSPATTGVTASDTGSASVPGTAPTSTPTTSTPPATALPTSESNHVRNWFFSDSGRYLIAQINAVGDPTGQLLGEGVTVLNTLQVTPSGSPTLPTTTTLPRPTGPGPRDPATARQAIEDAMNSAFNNQGPVPLQDSVQGGYPLGNTSQQAGRNANPSLIGNIVVRINWLQFLDSTHAELNFDLLKNNQPITATTTGSAVIENSQWKLGRDTYCQIIGRGGTISCPPQ